MEKKMLCEVIIIMCNLKGFGFVKLKKKIWIVFIKKN